MSSERSESRHLQRSLRSARPAIAELSPVGMTREKRYALLAPIFVINPLLSGAVLLSPSVCPR